MHRVCHSYFLLRLSVRNYGEANKGYPSAHLELFQYFAGVKTTRYLFEEMIKLL
jgi:hypothetical protein